MSAGALSMEDDTECVILDNLSDDCDDDGCVRFEFALLMTEEVELASGGRRSELDLCKDITKEEEERRRKGEERRDEARRSIRERGNLLIMSHLYVGGMSRSSVLD